MTKLTRVYTLKEWFDQPLKQPVRPYSSTFSAVTVLKQMFMPELLTDDEKRQITETN